ncbi:endoribonuclease L-PSP [Aeromicrobium marinum DSM 15272]|uniref:Endoribonuclease L-PSP n=1 Tax=Aeromicrobium marinum DSM 15272 TaxID=585531 RepID=E2SC76_9ACTN|nr:RidA family protein [Aeromicrobium marinum]EFQ83362.1 endoribonuclease L-PSP [Aeromicrobium marinum DSM 15272]
MSAVEERLAALGHQVPEVAAPVASYVPAVHTGQHVFTSGQLPFVEGRLLQTGKVGGEVSADEATACAEVCALNAIAAVRGVVGDLDRVTRIVKATVFVASTPDFTQQPQVANGASELFAAAFGAVGQHARSAVGVPVLPLDSPVEVEVVVEVGP